MTTSTISRTAHLLALTKKGEDVRPGQPGHCRDQSPARAPRAVVSAAVALVGCLRGSRNMRDASSPPQARSSVRRTARPSTSAKEADALKQEGSPVHVPITVEPPAGWFTACVVRP